MTPKTSVFLFYKLKPETDVEAFERRARDVEARLAAGSPGIVSYALTRLEGALSGTLAERNASSR